MSGSLARYHARSPRYVLDTVDNNLIRFSGAERSENSSWEERTEISNISLTGLSFTSAADLSPQLGEVIKIQFTVPGSKTMACYAIVIRISDYDESSLEIAVHFYKLDRLQRINLVQGLAQKMDVNFTRTPFTNKGRASSKKTGAEHFVIMTLMMISIITWLSLINYDWK